jgi:hypothetical protein
MKVMRFIQTSLARFSKVSSRLRSLLLICLLGIGVSSCLDIEEEISLNTDGSGRYRMSMDMSQMMELLQGFMSEEEGGMDMFDSVDSTLQVQVTTLRGIAGISNVSHRSENYVFSIGYDFANVAALNAASNQQGGMAGMESLGLPGSGESGEASGPAYDWSKTTFSRAQVSVEDVFAAAEEDEETAGMMDMAKMMMSDASYRIIYNFPGKVKKISNDAASLSGDKKTVTLDLKMLDILAGEADLGNKIKFKKR